MVIFTAKLSKPKCIGIVCAAAAVILLVIALANRSSAADLETAAGKKLSTTADQVEFLAQCGYTVSSEPVRTQEVRIPEEFNDVYTQYNALQQSQGFDLTKYQGKSVMQYVYLVEDYPDQGEPVYATLLLYKNKLIGGDLSRGGTDGFLKPLLSA
jgi:hypothetical protein